MKQTIARLLITYSSEKRENEVDRGLLSEIILLNFHTTKFSHY